MLVLDNAVDEAQVRALLPGGAGASPSSRAAVRWQVWSLPPAWRWTCSNPTAPSRPQWRIGDLVARLADERRRLGTLTAGPGGRGGHRGHLPPAASGDGGPVPAPVPGAGLDFGVRLEPTCATWRSAADPFHGAVTYPAGAG
ncbi:hypothetical protein ACFQX7_33050 [Luedemannella flava]